MVKKTEVDGINIRKYLRERRRQLNCDKDCLTTSSAKRTVNSAIAELMFLEQHLDDVDPIGKKIFETILNKKSYK